MRRRPLLFVVGFVLASATPAWAQTWDSPSFFSPRPGEDIGLYAMKPDDADWGFAAIWRQSGNINLGVRAGLAAGNHFSVGAEFFGPVELFGPQSGLLTAWVAGLGATFNEQTMFRVPLGVSAGVVLGTPGAMLITPYVHPRVALEVLARDLPGGGEQTETSVGLDVDIGVDASLGESLVLRVGATIGGQTTFGAGVAYRFTRRLIVR
jgi:hypothetical protein